MKTAPFHVFEFGEFRLDAGERLLFRQDGTAVPLTPRVFETLHYLVEHRGRVLDKESLMEAVWPDCIVEENNLAQNVSTLRRIFGDTPGAQRYIATVPGRGYRFVPEVTLCKNGAVRTLRESGAPGRKDEGRDSPEEISAFWRPHPRSLLAAAMILLAFGASVFFFPRSGPAPPVENLARSTSSPDPIPEKSIAVLPFVNLSTDPANAYFADGIKDEILTRVSRIAALKVISGTSTQKFKGASGNLRAIARELGVAHILEGSVQRSDEAVRVTVQLIHAQSDTHLWAESYDRKLTDMFQVETDVAQRIATALEATLTGSEKRALVVRPTKNFEAYQAYLKGRFFWNKRTIEGFTEAVEHLSLAIQVDPAYAQAYVGLADALLFLGGENLAGQEEAIRKGRALLQKALELDETLADAHASLGLLAMNSDWDWVEAEKEFRRAIELDPNYATAHHWYGEFLAYMGRFDEAIAESARAHELDPLSLIINTDVAKVYFMARRYGEAVTHFQAALKMDPEFAEAHGLLAMTYAKLGKHEEALGEMRKIRNLENHPAYLSWLAFVYGTAGRKDEGREVINRLNELSTRTYISPLWMVTAWIGLGESDEAFNWFERVFAEHAMAGAVSLKVNPLFDPVRPDPRFADLLRRARFTP